MCLGAQLVGLLAWALSGRAEARGQRPSGLTEEQPLKVGIELSSRYALRKDGDKGKGNSGRSARLATRKREARGNLGDNLRLSVRVVGGTRRCEGPDALRTGFVRVRAVKVEGAGPAGTKQKMRFISYRTLS